MKSFLGVTGYHVGIMSPHSHELLKLSLRCFMGDCSNAIRSVG